MLTTLVLNVSRCALDLNVNIPFVYIVLVPIVSRIITKDCGGKQGEKRLIYALRYRHPISLISIEIRSRSLISRSDIKILTENQYRYRIYRRAISESEIVTDMQESIRAHVSDIKIRDRDPISLCKIQG